MPDVSINFDLGKLSKAVRKEGATFLNLVATDLIVDTQQGLNAGLSQRGSGKNPQKQLSPITAKIKTAKGQPLTPLIATGTMRDRVKIGKRATPGSLSATVVVGGKDNPSRSFVGTRHQIGDGVPKRIWFPTKITKRFQPQLNKDIDAYEKRLVRSVKGR